MNVQSMIDSLGELTADDTVRLAQAALGELTDDNQIKAVMTSLDEDTLVELAAQIDDE